MKSFWLQVLQKLSTWFQELDLTGLALSFLKLGGVPGWIANIVLKYFGHKLEKKVDTYVDNTVTTVVSDSKIEDKKTTNETQIRDAKTDDELDEAYRNSLR